LVLDTHVWVWLVNGDERLGKSAACQAIDDASRQSLLRVCAISVWEVAMLTAKARMKLSLPVSDWVEQALAVPGLSLVPLEPSISIDSTALPGEFHGDPADRIIVATARYCSGTVVTADKAILAYARHRYITATEV
jgi:PIN domain nuclease of toxin-antitoxin system